MSFKQIKTILQVFFIYLISFGGARRQAQTSADSEKIVYSLVENITEVKAYCHKVDSLYHNDTTIKAEPMIVADPSKETPYYWVQVGVNDGDRLTPQYNFYVYLAKKEVKYLDTMTDRILTLAEWRKRKK